MRRTVSSWSLSLAVAAGALAFAACSDTVTTPPSARSAGAPSLTVGPTANVGTVHVTFASSAATQFCSAATLVHTYTVPGSAGPIAGCGTAFDLTNALTNATTGYNPGWSAPIASSVWIGPTANSNEYRPTPGSYFFQTTFTVDAGVTNPVLNDTLLSDNAVAVYLNGHQLGAQTIADCAQPKNTCNWQTAFKFVVSDNTPGDFNIGGLNTITVLLIDVPNDGNAGNGFTCGSHFQDNGERGFGTPFDVPTSPDHVVAGWTQNAATSCENPTGLDFHGTVSWVVPVSTIWCSPGFWVHNGLDLWSTSLKNSLYNASGPYPNDPQTFAGATFQKNHPGSQNPTLLEVISNPATYGGPATNNVASLISFTLFGTPESANPVENCPDVLPLPN